MRRLGYQTVDMLVGRLGDRSIPPLRRASPTEMRERLSGPQPRGPQSLTDILEQLERDVLPFAGRGDHPGYFAFVPFCGTWPGALGDFVASALNVFAGSWMEAAGPSQVELEVLEWFKDWIGYPAQAVGSLVSGGSAANMTALAVAREAHGAMSPDLVVYVGDQAHSSLARAARMLGFGPTQVRVLPTGTDLRLDPLTLAAAIEADVRGGRTPLFASASAGATNTGSVDPLGAIADVCAAHDVWLHADAAYGGFATLTERGRKALEGLSRADSVTLDPHKWLYQPYECGCLLVRDGRLLREAFEIVPDYLRDAVPTDAEVNFADLGMQLSRSARSFKLWFSLRYFGIDAFRDAIDTTLDLAAHAAALIERSPALEHLAPPSLGIVCFRRRFPDTVDESEIERRNAALASAVENAGIGLVSSTRLRGRYALRLCVLNHTTTAEAIERVLALIESADPAAHGLAGSHERHPDVRDSIWLEAASNLEGISLFAGLTAGERARSAAVAAPRLVEAGETIVEQWDDTRDFFVIADGTVAVLVGDEHVRTLGANDFFGELAALDWGAGFGYPRLATVVAQTPVRLLVFSATAFGDLLRDFPSIEAQVRQAMTERLPGR